MILRRRNVGRPELPAQQGAYEIDFTTTSAEEPLRQGGLWVNNTQGGGGYEAMNAQSSMRVIAAPSGGINMAGGDALGQSPPYDYLDSFAFVPGYGGNQRITAVVYVDPAGYSPTANHELELLLACSSANGVRTWISCTWDRTGARAMALMNGAPNGYSILSPRDLGSGVLADGDTWVAELYRSTNTVITYRNGSEVLNSSVGGSAAANAASIAVATGSGMGIGNFRRTAEGGSAANRYGFRSFRAETF